MDSFRLTEFTRPHVDTLDLSWAHLISPGLTTLLGSNGRIWNHLIELELNRIHLEALSLARTRLETNPMRR